MVMFSDRKGAEEIWNSCIKDVCRQGVEKPSGRNCSKFWVSEKADANQDSPCPHSKQSQESEEVLESDNPMTQKEMARRVGASQPSISRLID